MAIFRFPISTADFSKIREQGKVYVDKTGMMYDLVCNYDYVFLARPRRFGKSLLCSTFKAYFEGRKELFEGLKVMELEKEWKRCPVLHFDMSVLRNMSIPEAKSSLENLISQYENVYGRNPQCITPGARFRSLIHNAAEQTGEKVVVIIDEYDSPMLRLMYDKEQFDAMRTMLREFYQVLKVEDVYIRFVFITGITKFSQLSIFSELNNLKQISMLDEFSGICGITQQELDTVLRPCVQEYAQGLGVSTDDAYAILKKNYDGYHFSPNSKDVYAPFSLFNALTDKQKKSYWFDSATSTALLAHLERFHPLTAALDYDGATVNESQFSIPCENCKTAMPLLYQSGYLTIGAYNPQLDRYVMKIPNNEVRTGLIECLMPIILHQSEDDNNSLIADMAQALFDGDLAAALSAMRAYIAKIPYDIISKDDWDAKGGFEAFYKLLIYMVFSLLNRLVDTEVRSILGRADIVIKTSRDIFVIELNVDKTARAALKQIEIMGYATPYESDPRRVIKCGVSISSELRNIVQWCITDINGRKIASKDFKRSMLKAKNAKDKRAEA